MRGKRYSKIFFIVGVFLMTSRAFAAPKIIYLTDVEGDWKRIESFLQKNKLVSIDQYGRLHLAPGNNYFVFGGDAVDRGPDSTRIVEALVDFKKREPERVILIQGNRDINKMRIPFELSEQALQTLPQKMEQWLNEKKIPVEEYFTAATRLKWIFEGTMGAPNAFEFRRSELKRHSTHVSDEDVVKSFLEELGPNGAFQKYLLKSQLGAVIEDTLIVHGAITRENFGFLPFSLNRQSDVRLWIEKLNTWSHSQVLEWMDREPRADKKMSGYDLVRYQQKTASSQSVVYARFSDQFGNPVLPPLEIIETMKDQGIRRILVGHTPSGDIPTILRWFNEFEVIIGDNSGRQDSEAASTLIADDDVHFSAITMNGQNLKYSLKNSPEVGLKTRDGFLIKAITPEKEAILFKVLPGFVVQEFSKPLHELDLQSLHPPYNPIDCASVVGSIALKVNP
ncbi:MAG: hypothetical protein JWQ35_1052 [Bacteriovoracaceae bacterium]|nr:hypothetical protein [Bacteriovoracaceae bacterium]